MADNTLEINNKQESLQIISEVENFSSRIVNLWQSISDENDLLNLINIVSVEIFGQTEEKSQFYTLKQLHFHAHSNDNEKLYITFRIPKKKRGEFRTIDAPNSTLKGIQQCLNYIFQQIYTPNKYAVGFVPNRSIVDGAKVHTSQKFVYNIDLKDFFPSISSGRLYKRLQSKPFCLNPQIASLVSDLCCYKNAENKSVLPQGAPTSPTITNFICERLDRKLCKLAVAYGLKYTRYADDITFSGMKNIFSENGKFCKSLRNIIENEEHFTINKDKTRLCHIGMRQEVTGLTVNEKVNVSRKYVKQLRTMIHNWETNGYEEAQSTFIKLYEPTKQLSSNPRIENVIGGKLDFLKMVKGESDSIYKNLNERFKILSVCRKLAIESQKSAEATIDMYKVQNPDNQSNELSNTTGTSIEEKLNQLFESNFDLSIL